MKTNTFAAALAILVASTGLSTAETLSPEAAAAKQQLADTLGIDVNSATYHEMVKLNCTLMGAETEAERTRLLEGFGTEPAAVIPGDHGAQIANDLGVDPGDFTLAQLVYMKGLIEGQNCSVERAAQMAKAGETITPEAASAKGQLAAVLGVEPSDYTLLELVKMKWVAEGQENGN